MSEAILEQLRAICLSFPEATEKEAWGAPTFRVRDKLFAMWDDHHHGAAHLSMWCKAPGGVQEILVGAAPQRFFVPPYVGHKGWIGVHLDVDVDWDEVHDLLKDSYLMTAPKKVAARLETAPAPPEPTPRAAAARRAKKPRAKR